MQDYKSVKNLKKKYRKMNSLCLSGKVFCLVTGASRGIGKEIALHLSKLLEAESTLVLSARSLTDLENVKQQIASINEKLCVQVVEIDLSKVTDSREIEQKIFHQSQAIENFQRVVVFHNAGSVGQLTSVSDLSQIDVWKEYFTVNMFSAAVITSAILGRFPNLKKYIINITSICAKKPFSNMSLYCSGKAARESYFNVLAAERSHDTTVLSYSPGPVDTDMFHNVAKNIPDSTAKAAFQKMKDSVLSAAQTVDKLFNILINGNYDSGAVIDYFDQA